MKKSPGPVDRHVGSRVRMRRILMGLSQEKLGEALGLTFQQVQKYEKGSNRIGASRLQQIAEVLETSVNFFFEGAPSDRVVSEAGSFGEAQQSTYSMDLFSSADGIQLAKAFVSIKDAKLRRRIVDLVIALAEDRGAPK